MTADVFQCIFLDIKTVDCFETKKDLSLDSLTVTRLHCDYSILFYSRCGQGVYSAGHDANRLGL